ncbi:STAS domain-containing protein [uncultured Streptomyces sp.]|uniref:STAS domain-containing protein n=1 Tax=uncultured Streptomyces sp. TaxID=174707 RepID=UPI002612B7FD|nr:STAS domain-containing protein [uncultured Streptomyces sp.]
MTAGLIHLAPTHLTGPLAVLAVGGEIDLETAPALRDEALVLIREGHTQLVLDLGEVFFCDSSGLNALIGILRCAKAAGGSLTLAAVPDRVTRMLAVTGVAAVIASYPDADAAMTALGLPPAPAPASEPVPSPESAPEPSREPI